MTYRQRALNIARGEVGVKESPAGSNSGKRVREYQAATSLGGTGWPWCAAFVNWCYKQAGRPLVELNRSASVAVLLAEARKKGWAHNHLPQPGDIACYDWDSINGPGHGDHSDHVGIVLRVSGSNFEAVEGNTSISSNSNGGQVMVRVRSHSMVEGYIRVPGAVPVPRPFVLRRAGKIIFRRRSLKAMLAALRKRNRR